MLKPETKVKIKNVAEKIGGTACIIVGLIIGGVGVNMVRPKKKYISAEYDPHYTTLGDEEE